MSWHTDEDEDDTDAEEHSAAYAAVPGDTVRADSPELCGDGEEEGEYLMGVEWWT